MKEIELTRGKVAIVDDEDFEWLNQWKWHYNTRYAYRREGKSSIWMHRFIFGESPAQVDHKDGNSLNNTRANLRAATQQQNNFNSRKYKNNTSGTKGVGWRENLKKYVAYIRHNRKRIHLGCFTTLQQAQEAYANKAKELFREFARPN